MTEDMILGAGVKMVRNIIIGVDDGDVEWTAMCK